MPTLTELAAHFHCDKVERHGYMPFYEKHLGNREIKTFLELGIGDVNMMKMFRDDPVPQASLRMWRDYFRDALIIGIDNQPSTMVEGEERILTLLCDQRDEAGMRAIGEKYGPFQVIVDDARHEPEFQIAAFELMWPYVEDGGIYCVEDCAGYVEVAAAIGGQVFDGGKQYDDFIVWKVK